MGSPIGLQSNVNKTNFSCNNVVTRQFESQVRTWRPASVVVNASMATSEFNAAPTSNTEMECLKIAPHEVVAYGSAECYHLVLQRRYCSFRRHLQANGVKKYHFLVAFLLSLLLWSRCLGVAIAAPQSCILCDKEDLKAKDPHASYEEFLFEHQVTRQDAINTLRALNDSFYEGPSADIACKSVVCTKTVMKYCRGSQFINDHCWCELGHTDEGLPYVPHICYVGEKVYTASVGSCFFYEEVKECCCAPELAKQWRHISVASRIFRKSMHMSILTYVMLIIAGHLTGYL